MCEHGINVEQLKFAIGQTDDAIALAQKWLEQLHHLADHGHQHDASAAIAQANVLLAEARGKLEKATGDLDAHGSDDVSVELV